VVPYSPLTTNYGVTVAILILVTLYSFLTEMAREDYIHILGRWGVGQQRGADKE
jgi:hypothetical protein